MNIDRVKARLTPEERAEAAAAIREMLDKRRYTGWTGKAETGPKRDYMCVALELHDGVGAELAKKAIEAQIGENYSLGLYLDLSPRACVKHDGHRKTALRWWRDFIKALEEE